jgi:NDP-sugar pyrophosphorylase family protein
VTTTIFFEGGNRNVFENCELKNTDIIEYSLVFETCKLKNTDIIEYSLVFEN